MRWWPELRPDPLGELTVLPQVSTWTKGEGMRRKKESRERSSERGVVEGRKRREGGEKKGTGVAVNFSSICQCVNTV